MVYLISFFSNKTTESASVLTVVGKNGKRAPSELVNFIIQSWLGLDLAFTSKYNQPRESSAQFG